MDQCRIARSSTAVFTDLLLACYLANATCAIANIMTTLIFIIVSRLHPFFLVVPVRSSLHVLVVVAVISYFQQCGRVSVISDGLDPLIPLGRPAELLNSTFQPQSLRLCLCSSSALISFPPPPLDMDEPRPCFFTIEQQAKT